MNKRQYLTKLIDLCTSEQQELFSRMYPDGVTSKQLIWATTQLENTLRNLNVTKQQVKDITQHAKTQATQYDKQIQQLKQEIKAITLDLGDKQKIIDQIHNPININNSEVQDRLRLLDALESGGVDNWEWYDMAIEEARKI